MSSKKSTIKLPRLRTKDELLKTSPELFNKLLLGEDMSSARSTIPAQTKQATLRPVQSAGHGGQSALHRVASKTGQLATYDTPRGFGDEPLTIDQELAIELESVKRERQQLLESISQIKAESGTAGGEAQQGDIRQLLKELELKKAKLNELKQDSRKAESAIFKMRDDDTDAQRLTPDDCIEETAYIKNLRDEMTRVEEDLLEAEAKNRLYYLLGERTRREHMAIDQKVRDKQESKRACLEDLANLTEHFNATRAAKELAEKELAKTKRQFEEARSDWMRKIRERRAEVRELKKRQQKERDKEVKRREKQLEKEKSERAAQAKLKMEQEAYQLQVAALAPKIEAMEASWNRLRAISGAETPNEVVEYWQGLKAKEQRMQELVALAECREAACKAEVSQLLASRSAMFESSKAAAAVAAAALAAAEAAADAARAAGAQGEEDVDVAAARIEEAEKRMDAAQVQFNKLRSICVAAEQGMRSLLQRLMIALEEAPAVAPMATQSPHIHHSPTAHAAGTSAGSRMQSAGASSTSGSHAGGLDGMRRSNGGAAGGRQGRGTKEMLAAAGQPAAATAVDASLASKAARLNSNRNTRSANPQGNSAGLPLNLAGVPEDASSASLGSAGRGTPGNSGAAAVSGLPLASIGNGGALSATAAAAAAVASNRPMLPSRERNTIDGDSFFEGLPQLLSDVTERLERLLTAGESIDYQAIRAAAAAAAAEGSGFAPGSHSSTASTAAGTVQATPRVNPDAQFVAAAAEAAAAAAAAGVVAAAAAEGANSEGLAAVPEGAEGAGSGSLAEEDNAEAGAAAGEDQEDAEAGEGTEQEPGGGDEPEEDGGEAPTAAEGDCDAQGPDGEQVEGEAAADASKDDVTADTVGITDAVDAASGESAEQLQQQQHEGPADVATTELTQQCPAVAAAAAEGGSGSGRPGSSGSAGSHAGSPGGASTAAAGSPPAVAFRSSVVSIAAPPVPAVALAVGGNMHTVIPESEKALMKGLYRRTWTGAPWLDAVSDNPLEVNLVPSMKRKKGKKKEAAAAPDLTRILGYTPPTDVPAESESEEEADEDAGAGPGADGVVDREWIKMRAAKMTARHNAKQAAAAAAQQGR